MKKKANSYTPIGYSYFIHAPRLLRSPPPSPFTQPEAESTTNLFAKPNEQNDACIKSAMARKGGCEETNVFDKPKAESCLHELC
jgi:hypothetical protein